MTTVNIPENSPIGKAITGAAEAYNLDPEAFAAGLLNAVLLKKAQQHPAQGSTPAPPTNPKPTQN